jgi:hypothetical protein
VDRYEERAREIAREIRGSWEPYVVDVIAAALREQGRELEAVKRVKQSVLDEARRALTRVIELAGDRDE